MTWDDVKSSWSDGWSYLWNETRRSLSSLIEANPSAYQGQAEAFLRELTLARTNLDAMKPLLKPSTSSPQDKALLEQYLRLEHRYQELAAGFYAEAQPAQKPSLGWLPVLVVGGLAISAAAAAWAVPGYQYAVNLREQTSLAVKELEARVTASKEGRTLQPSTLPPPPDPPSLLGNSSGGGSLLMVGALALGGFLILPRLLKTTAS